MKIVCIIPARMDSKRFPGKPLALIKGKPMIQWVYDTAKEVFDRVVVATGDTEIMAALDGEYIGTPNWYKNGTERCAGAVRIMQNFNHEFPDVVINLQCDEPFITPEHLEKVAVSFINPEVEITTLRVLIEPTDDPDIVKVAVDKNGDALYFSRKSISEWKHIGVYGYRTEILKDIATLPEVDIEREESLEQLRWLYHGYKVRTIRTHKYPKSINSKQDLQ